MKKVFQSDNYLEAQIVLGLLQSDGFAAESSGNFLLGGVGELPAADFYILRVPEAQHPAAKQLVTDYEKGDLDFDFNFEDID
jgi:hypothetical protein